VHEAVKSEDLGFHMAAVQPAEFTDSARTDQQLIQEFLSGNQEAFAEIFQRHKKFTARIAARYFTNLDQIEDAVQEAFLRASAELEKFRGEHDLSFKSWLSRVTANVCIDIIRRKNRRPEGFDTELSEADKSTLNLALKSPQVESRLISKDLAEKILSRLSAIDRAILLMLYCEEMSIAEISSALNISKSSVKIRAWRARRNLKSLFKDFC
jgi:RNA polymerase sigma-70 factor (ECF subfamily)